MHDRGADRGDGIEKYILCPRHTLITSYKEWNIVMNPRSHIYGTLVLAFVVFVGLTACQEETETVTTTPATTSSTVTNPPSQVPQQSRPESEQRLLTGDVIAIDGMKYTVKDLEGKLHTVQGTSSTLIDDALSEGHRVEVRFSGDHQAIAIRKVRPESMTESVDAGQSSGEEHTLHGQLTRIDKEQSHYLITTKQGQIREVSTDSKTLIDESVRIGDQVQVKLAMENDNQAIAIRKVRP